MPEDTETVRRVDEHRLNDLVVTKGRGEILQFAVDSHGNNRAVSEEVKSGLAHLTTLAACLIASEAPIPESGCVSSHGASMGCRAIQRTIDDERSATSR